MTERVREVSRTKSDKHYHAAMQEQRIGYRIKPTEGLPIRWQALRAAGCVSVRARGLALAVVYLECPLRLEVGCLLRRWPAVDSSKGGNSEG